MAAMDDDRKRAVALFRFGVLGPLVSARLEHGDRRAHFEAAAQRDYVTPDGRIVRISARTIEAWYYDYRRRGLEGLAPDARADSGISRSMTAEVTYFGSHGSGMKTLLQAGGGFPGIRCAYVSNRQRAPPASA
jgi:hypothetical protein